MAKSAFDQMWPCGRRRNRGGSRAGSRILSSSSVRSIPSMRFDLVLPKLGIYIFEIILLQFSKQRQEQKRASSRQYVTNANQNTPLIDQSIYMNESVRMRPSHMFKAFVVGMGIHGGSNHKVDCRY
jgi:hypothetical protein